MNDEIVSNDRIEGEDSLTNLITNPFPSAQPENQGNAEISNIHEENAQETFSKDETCVWW